MLAAEPRIFVRKAADFDIPAGKNTEFLSMLAIGNTSVRKMEGVMELTVVQFGVDEISAFGSFVVALPIFGADRLRS